jgi:hypothetical protein
MAVKNPDHTSVGKERATPNQAVFPKRRTDCRQKETSFVPSGKSVPEQSVVGGKTSGPSIHGPRQTGEKDEWRGILGSLEAITPALATGGWKGWTLGRSDTD